MATKTVLGARLRHAREAKDISQETLAEMLKISQPTISAYEMGTVPPGLKRLKVILGILGVPRVEWDEFIAGVDEIPDAEEAAAHDAA